jgi:serine protease Do
MSSLLLQALLPLALTLPLEGPAELHLSEGHMIRGSIVKESSDEVFVDVGYTILQVPRKAILNIVPTAESGEAPLEEAELREEHELWVSSERAEVSVRENVERTGEGVVLVKVPGAQGSGFVTGNSGHVITNAHVVEGEQQITLTFFQESEHGFDKRVVDDIELIAINPYWDLALLKIPEEQRAGLALKPIPFGDMQEVRVGESVFAIGNPMGLERSVSEGIVSTKNRAEGGMLYIQTTAAINPGNSGGPLFNMKGEMIGVTSWKYVYAESLNFAIPVSTVKTFLRNYDAFAYDEENPNSGYRYQRPPGMQR